MDTIYVYDWRLEAEEKLRERKGSGMTDEQVKIFVDGCESECCSSSLFTNTPDYPSYELYTDQLRQGTFPGQPGKQLRLVVSRDRKVQEVVRL